MQTHNSNFSCIAQKHLESVSEDRSQDILSCVQILQNTAVATAVAQERARSSRMIELVRENIATELEREEPDFGLLDADDFWHAPEGPHITTPTRKKPRVDYSPTTTPIPLNQQEIKTEKRNGHKLIPELQSFRFMKTTEEKLKFIAKNKDPDTGKYENNHRHWLLRNNPIADCFLVCCSGDVPHFMTKHCDGEGKYTNASIKGLSGCTSCKERLEKKINLGKRRGDKRKSPP